MPEAKANIELGQILSQADHARDGRNWSQGRDFYAEYLHCRPDDAPIWVQYGHCLKESGDLVAAEMAYRRSLEIAGEAPDTHLQLGRLLKLRGSKAKAIRAYRRALELDPARFDALKELAGILAERSARMSIRAAPNTDRLVIHNDMADSVANLFLASSDGPKARPRNGRGVGLRSWLNVGIEAYVETLIAERIQPVVERALSTQIEALVERVVSATRLPHQLYQPNDLVSGSMPSEEYMSASNPVARDFFHPEFQQFCKLYHCSMELHRKHWEWAYIFNRLSKSNVLRPGRRGLGFAVGKEKLPALFASFGADIVATDAPTGQNWQSTTTVEEHMALLFDGELIDLKSFNERVCFEYCDMSDIPDHLTDFDFIWSSCSFEHLGGIDAGIDFVVDSLEKTLKPGGVACHTTELNLSSNEDTIDSGPTVLYREQDLARLRRRLEARGHWVEPLRIEAGTLPPDYYVAIPPYRGNPHLKLSIQDYVCTSVGLFIRRA